jgi:hypothetical protein
MIDTITQLELDRFNEESNSLPQTIEIEVGSVEWIEICEFAKCL